MTSQATDQKAEILRSRVQRSIDSARSNRDLSQEAKRRQIARAYLDLRTGLAELEAEKNKGRATRIAELERKLFGIPNRADASSMISYRDAIDRASQITKEQSALATMQRAQTSGDDLLVRAILATAYEREWVHVINTFAEAKPDLDPVINELWDLRQAQADLSDDLFNYVAGAPPRELSMLTELDVRKMAADAPPVNSIAVFS